MHGRRAIFSFFIPVTAALSVGNGLAVAGERLAMPFSCRVDGGSVRLTPGSEQVMPIVGARQERVVLACATGRPVQCRTMIAHNFTVMCGGQRVSWMRVAEAIGGRRASRVWREGEQLHIALLEHDAAGPVVASPAPCTPDADGAEQSNAAPGGEDLIKRVALKPCKEAVARELHFVLPTGFAPVAHFGAQIVTQTAAPTTSGGVATLQAADGGPVQAPVVAAATRADVDTRTSRQRLLERTVLTEPLPEIGGSLAPQANASGVRDRVGPRDYQQGGATEISRGTQMETGGLSAAVPAVVPRLALASSEVASRVRTGWSATVTPSETVSAAILPSVSLEPASTLQRDAMLWLVLTSLFVTAGWFIWFRPDRVAGLARRVSGDAMERLTSMGGDSGPFGKVASALFKRTSSVLSAWKPAASQSGTGVGGYPIAGLDAVFGSVAGVVAALPRELPLRDVLDDELRRVRQRLAVAKATANDAQVPAAAYRVLMRDMERIRRIGESARDSVIGQTGNAGAAALGSGRMPRTRTEAFELLGLNASVSEVTIKKCVDALRMSWHPDLAHDAADLALREERIKQINVAMELISGKPPQG